MIIPDFKRDVLEPMKLNISGIDYVRVGVAYRDVLNLFDLITNLENWANFQRQILHEASSEESDFNVDEIVGVDRTISTLHKALIEFANIFSAILVHEAQQRPSSECTIRALAEKPIAGSIKLEVLHRAYCLNIYRNKIIAHHEVLRYNAELIEANGTRRLYPIPSPGFSQTDVQKLFSLKTKYSALPGIALEINPYELLNALYYAIPSPHGCAPSEDRKTINKIAERGGCRSMSPDEIIATVDAFSLEVARLAPF